MPTDQTCWVGLCLSLAAIFHAATISPPEPPLPDRARLRHWRGAVFPVGVGFLKGSAGFPSFEALQCFGSIFPFFRDAFSEDGVDGCVLKPVVVESFEHSKEDEPVRVGEHRVGGTKIGGSEEQKGDAGD